MDMGFKRNDYIDIDNTMQYTYIEAKYGNVVSALGEPRQDHTSNWWTFQDGNGYPYTLCVENNYEKEYLIGSRNKQMRLKERQGPIAFRRWLLKNIKDSKYNPRSYINF
jgi:hypothetical protein